MPENRYCVTGVLTTGQYARANGVSTATIYRAVKAGKIKSVLTPGGHYRIPYANSSVNISFLQEANENLLKWNKELARTVESLRGRLKHCSCGGRKQWEV